MTIGPVSSGLAAASIIAAQPPWQLPTIGRLGRVGVQLAHAMHELPLRVADIQHGLLRLRLREEDHEIDRVAVAQRHADLRVVLEPADAGAVPGARVDDDVRAALRIDRHALRRDDAHQRVVDRALERPPVDHHLVVEVQHRRQPLPRALDEVVAALAQRVPEQDRPLSEVHRVLRASGPDVPGRHRLRHQRGNLLLVGFLDALAEALLRQLGAGLKEVCHFRGDVVASGKLAGRIGHGFSRGFSQCSILSQCSTIRPSQ